MSKTNRMGKNEGQMENQKKKGEKNVIERKLNEVESVCGQCSGHFTAVPSLSRHTAS